MSSCEKCWSDAGGNADRYRELVTQRNESGNYCTPEQRAGVLAGACPWCGRMTLHQHTGQPMCGCPKSRRQPMPEHPSAETQEAQS